MQNKGLINGIEVMSGILLGVVTLLIFVAAFARYFLQMAIPDGFDLSRLLLAVSIMWGLAAATAKDSHIRVDVIWMMLPDGAKRIVNIFAEILTLLFLVLFAWMFITALYNVYSSNEQTFDLRMPIWPAYALGWLGLAGAVLMSISRILRMILRPDAADLAQNHIEMPHD